MPVIGDVTPMATRTAAASAAKARIRDAAQARILDAAAEVFARKGQAATTMVEIARIAGLPPANIHYYFTSKTALYDAVLTQVLTLWTHELEQIDAKALPEVALAAYIEAKMRVSFEHPAASRIVASEVLQGGERIKTFLKDTFMPMLTEKLDVIDGWRQRRDVRDVDATHLLFMIWASTEFYANFSAEITTILGSDALAPDRFAKAAASVVDLVLNGALPRKIN